MHLTKKKKESKLARTITFRNVQTKNENVASLTLLCHEAELQK